MKPAVINQVINLGNGRQITIETGKLAKQADGSVVVRMGDTMLLATVVANKEANEGIDFLPLTIDYREKFAAAGRIPGGFMKRETRPSDNEILTMRLVDRVLRPLFPKDYHAEVQIMIQLMSYEKGVLPEALAGLAASAAISISDIPFEGPISEVRIARVKGKYIINPTAKQLENTDIDMIIGASMDSVVMVEGEMDEISEMDMLEAIKIAHKAIKIQIQAQLDLAAKIEKSHVKREYCHVQHNEELAKQIKEHAYDKIYNIVKSGTAKQERSEKFTQICDEFCEGLDTNAEDYDLQLNLAKTYFEEVKKEAVRHMILNESIRLDGRKPHDIRPIWCEIDYLPKAHGSAIFTRGETQSLTTVTLCSSLDANRIDSVTYQGEENFYLHYNFPPFSTGEAKPIRGVSRREIGHGNLAQRALKGMISDRDPYTVRVVSEILESNGFFFYGYSMCCNYGSYGCGCKT